MVTTAQAVGKLLQDGMNLLYNYMTNMHSGVESWCINQIVVIEFQMSTVTGHITSQSVVILYALRPIDRLLQTMCTWITEEAILWGIHLWSGTWTLHPSNHRNSKWHEQGDYTTYKCLPSQNHNHAQMMSWIRCLIGFALALQINHHACAWEQHARMLTYARSSTQHRNCRLPNGSRSLRGQDVDQ